MYYFWSEKKNPLVKNLNKSKKKSGKKNRATLPPVILLSHQPNNNLAPPQSLKQNPKVKSEHKIF